MSIQAGTCTVLGTFDCRLVNSVKKQNIGKLKKMTFFLLNKGEDRNTNKTTNYEFYITQDLHSLDNGR